MVSFCDQRIVLLVMGGHFLSAFTVLGAPLFLPRFLPMLHPTLPHWGIGALFCLPTVMTALAAPFWGWVSDHYGRKRSLQRAHFGLAAGFIIAGSTSHLSLFIAGLAVQGFFGGAMAASNAYLTTQINRSHVQAILAGTQISARLAMVIAPATIGMLLDTGLGTRLYVWLGILPLLALLSTIWLPADNTITPHHGRSSSCPPLSSPFTTQWPLLLALQAAVSAAPVLTFPYFVPYCRHLGLLSSTLAGGLYALPQLLCLLGLPWLRHTTHYALLPLGLIFLGSACCGHVFLAFHIGGGQWELIIILSILRLLMGIGLVLALTGLNTILSHLITPQHAGSRFSRFDAAGKWAGAAAGISAGFLVQTCGVLTPFCAAVFICFVSVPFSYFLVSFEKES